jgi:hypothetical protein
LKDNIHQALHNIFANDLPHEQILRLITQIDFSVLRREFVDRILEICNEPNREIYKKIFFRK